MTAHCCEVCHFLKNPGVHTMSAAAELVSPGVASGFDYARHREHMNRGAIVRRQRSRVTPSNGGTVWSFTNGNQMIDYLFPTAGFADLSSTWLGVELDFTAGETTGLCLSAPGAASLIDSVTLLTTGGSAIYTTRDYPTIVGMLMRGHTPEFLEGKANTMGMGSVAQRQTDAAGSNRIRLNFDLMGTPLFNGDLHPPLFAQGLMIRILLRRDSSALFAVTGSDASYTIRNARLNVDIMFMNEQMTNSVAGVLEDGGAIRAVVDVFEVLQKSISTADNNLNVEISKYCSDLFTVFGIFVPTANINVMNQDEFDSSEFPNMDFAQLVVGPDVFPNQATDLTGNGFEGLMLLRQCTQRLQSPVSALMDIGKNFTTFNSGSGRQFMLAMPMFKDLNASVGGGYRTDNPNEPMILQLRMSAPPAVAYTLYAMAHYRGLLVWRAGSLQLITSGIEDEVNVQAEG